MPYEKVGKNEPVCIAGEVPFEIPESWEWARLGMISTYSHTKQKINAQNADPNMWGLDLEDIERGGRLLERKTVGERKAVGYKTFFDSGDILYSKLRPYLLKILVAPDCGICTPEIIPFKVFGNLDPEYIVAFLKCPYVDAVINSVTYGVKMPRVGTETMTGLLVPIPPLSEQKRIVQKLSEVMPFTNSYTEAYVRATELNQQFPDLLKKSILQEAVQGKLVPQDPTDEPAFVLLERIREEKQKLIAEGKIKKDKHETVIFRRDNSHYEKLDGIERCIDDEIPFEVPESWAWVRFGTALINRDAERVPLPASERSRLEKKYDYYGASGVIDKVDRFLFEKPLLLIGEDGANLLLRSKPIAFIATKQYWVNNHAHVLDSVAGLLLDYVALYINAINLAPYVTGTAQPKMNQEKMNSILIPIPPTNEQQGIIEKVHELFSICKQL